MLQALVHNAVCRGFIKKKTRYKSIISKVNTEELMKQNIKDEVSKNGEHVLIT